jgi:hypothetical protein
MVGYGAIHGAISGIPCQLSAGAVASLAFHFTNTLNILLLTDLNQCGDPCRAQYEKSPA